MSWLRWGLLVAALLLVGSHISIVDATVGGGGGGGGSNWSSGTDSNIAVSGTEAPGCWCVEDYQSGAVAPGNTLTCHWPGTVACLAEDTLLTGSSDPLQDTYSTWDFGDDDQDWSVTRSGQSLSPSDSQIGNMAFYTYLPDHDDFTDVVGSCDGGSDDCAQYTISRSINSLAGSASGDPETWTVNVVDPYDTYSGSINCYYDSGSTAGTSPTGCTPASITTVSQAFDDCNTGGAKWVRLKEGDSFSGWTGQINPGLAGNCLFSTYSGSDDAIIPASRPTITITDDFPIGLEPDSSSPGALWFTGFRFVETTSGQTTLFDDRVNTDPVKRVSVSNLKVEDFNTLANFNLSTNTYHEDIYFFRVDANPLASLASPPTIGMGFSVRYGGMVASSLVMDPIDITDPEHLLRIFAYDRQNWQLNYFENTGDGKEQVAIRGANELVQKTLEWNNNQHIYTTTTDTSPGWFILVGGQNQASWCYFLEDMSFRRNGFSLDYSASMATTAVFRDGATECASSGSDNGYIDNLVWAENYVNGENATSSGWDMVSRGDNYGGTSNNFRFLNNVLVVPEADTGGFTMGFDADDAGVCMNNVIAREDDGASDGCGDTFTGTADANGNIEIVMSGTDTAFDAVVGIPTGGAGIDFDDLTVTASSPLVDVGVDFEPPADPDLFGGIVGDDTVNAGLDQNH